MSSSNGSSSGSSSSGGRDRDRDRRAPSPVAQRDAPAGAYLGSRSDGTKLVSEGGGRASIVSESSGERLGSISLPEPAPWESRANDIRTVPVAETPSRPAAPVTGGSRPSSESGGGSVPTDVTQQPPAGGDTGGPQASSPRTDFSPVLAGLVGLRRSRSPYLSNNFVSLVGKSGGLGRRTGESKRSLIGGA